MQIIFNALEIQPKYAIFEKELCWKYYYLSQIEIRCWFWMRIKGYFAGFKLLNRRDAIATRRIDEIYLDFHLLISNLEIVGRKYFPCNFFFPNFKSFFFFLNFDWILTEFLYLIYFGVAW